MAMTRGHKQSPEHVRRRVEARLRTLARKPLPVSVEWLRVKYIDERLDCVIIARMVGRDPKTVWSWLKRSGIQIRPRGGTTSGHPFKRGEATFRGRRHTDETRQILREARLTDGHVPYLRNGRHWLKETGARHPHWRGGVTPERQSFYQSGEWKAAVKTVWHRADAKCERCGLDHRAVRGEVVFHVHHIISFAVRERRSDVSNLTLLCAQCHRHVHSKANITREFIKEASHGHR